RCVAASADGRSSDSDSALAAGERVASAGPGPSSSAAISEDLSLVAGRASAQPLTARSTGRRERRYPPASYATRQRLPRDAGDDTARRWPAAPLAQWYRGAVSGA